ncbi:hypothetical protein [Paenibacillus contaminans]|uniref:DUF2179 domain-containing protein n=1 Tax=Paenibacillus contaminans TaxID=450362 RepID=A0A329MHB7_9BACL|nr:hypothetical protein [Paenibacillus contaminans]RAV19341.1 hypothetical protein DQG23_20295 [Paenibacillus contaminans]
MRPLVETAWHPVTDQAEIQPAAIKRLTGAAADRLEVMCSAIAFAILAVIMFLEINLMPHRTTLNRVMRVRSAKGDEIGTALKQATGREPTMLGSKEEGDGTIVYALQIDIYRLEESTLKDVIYAIDPDAVIDMLPQYSVYRGGRPTDKHR